MHDLVYIALGAVLIAVCSWISVPTEVPFTLQTMGVFLEMKVAMAFKPLIIGSHAMPETGGKGRGGDLRSTIEGELFAIGIQNMRGVLYIERPGSRACAKRMVGKKGNKL